MNRVLSFAGAAPNTASSLLRRCYLIYFCFCFLFVSRYFNQCIDNDVHTKIKCINLQNGRKRKIQSVESMAVKCTIFVYEMRCGANKWKRALDTLSTKSFSFTRSLCASRLHHYFFFACSFVLLLSGHMFPASVQFIQHSPLCACALQNMQHLFACTQRSLVL